MEKELIELNVLFLKMDLEGKKEAYNWAREKVDKSNKIMPLILEIAGKTLDEEDEELREADKEEVETYLKVMKSIIEWEEAREKVEELNKKMKEKKNKKGREYSA